MKKTRFVSVFAAALLALLFLASGADAAIMAGAGKVDITPPLGMPLSGYGNRINEPSTGVHDPVFARALVMESGGKRVAIVSADLLMMSLELKKDLEGRLSDLDLDFLSVSATHTHYSTGAYIDNKVAEIAVMGKYDPEAYELVVSGMEEAVRAAASELVPVKIGSASADCPVLSTNRRHQDGPVDPTIRVVGVWKEDGGLLALFMNHAVHPTTVPSTTTLVTGDVAGRAEAWFEEKYDGAVAMFLNAGLGDQSPGKKGMKGTWEVVDEVGTGMAEAADTALSSIEPSSDVELEYYVRSFDMPKPKLRWSLQCWGGLNQLFPVFGKDMIREEGAVSGVRLGDALFLFSPAEVTYDIQRHLQESFPERTVLVVTHSNDIYGYVVTPEDYKTGGYETCMNFYGPEFGPYLEEQFVTMVKGDSMPGYSCPCGAK